MSPSVRFGGYIAMCMGHINYYTSCKKLLATLTECCQRHSVLRDYSGFVRFSYEDPVRLGMQIAFG